MVEKTDVLLIRPNDAKAVYGQAVSNAACEPPFWAVAIASYLQKRGGEYRFWMRRHSICRRRRLPVRENS